MYFLCQVFVMLYKGCRACLTNHMGSISCHVTLLVNSSLAGRHTHTNTHTDHLQTKAILRNQVHAGLLKEL